MRGICAAHRRRAGRRRVAARRLGAILILLLGSSLGMTAAVGLAPGEAQAAGYQIYMGTGGGCATGDPDDGEHRSGPQRLPLALDGSGETVAPVSTYVAPAAASSTSQVLLPADVRASLALALWRSARPLVWLALTARHPWACDPLWLVRVSTTTSGRLR